MDIHTGQFTGDLSVLLRAEQAGIDFRVIICNLMEVSMNILLATTRFLKHTPITIAVIVLFIYTGLQINAMTKFPIPWEMTFICFTFFDYIVAGVLSRLCYSYSTATDIYLGIPAIPETAQMFAVKLFAKPPFSVGTRIRINRRAVL